MEEIPINFYTEEIVFSLDDSSVVSAWLKIVADEENRSIQEVNYIFCSDDFLLEINKKYLNHDSLTDIITFDHSKDAFPGQETENNAIYSDIYISIDRVKENAPELNTSFENELHRVMVHGLLHLCGYNDKTEEERADMRVLENKYLSLFS